MRSLKALITDRRGERGWTYADLQERSDDTITRQRWQQLGTGVRIKEFPEPTTLRAMAQALEVDVTAVVLAAASSIGLEVRMARSELAQLLPAGTDNLTPEQRDAVLQIVRVLVRAGSSSDSSERAVGLADTLSSSVEGEMDSDVTSTSTPKRGRSSRRSDAG